MSLTRDDFKNEKGGFLRIKHSGITELFYSNLKQIASDFLFVIHNAAQSPVNRACISRVHLPATLPARGLSLSSTPELLIL